MLNSANRNPSPEVIKKISCSTQLSMKFSLLINMKMPTKVDIFIFISREISSSAMFSKTEFAIVGNLRFISRANFMLRVKHEKFYNLWAKVRYNIFFIALEKRGIQIYTFLLSPKTKQTLWYSFLERCF